MSRTNAAGWIRFLDRCAAKGVQLHSVVAHHHGERIVRGFAEPWGEQHQQLVYSMSKTFCSAAAGLAVADGAFSYDDLIVDLFPDQVDDRVGPKARTITVRHLLSMSSGHTQEMIDTVTAETGGVLCRDSIGAFLRHEPEGTPGVTFAYNQPCTWTVSRVVSERTGRSVHDLLLERVFPAIGAGPTYWATDADGIPLGFSGLHLTTDTLAGFAQLILDEGRVGDQQVLAPEWVDQHHRKWVETVPFESGTPDWTIGYGWQVWQCQHGWRGDGAFGQYGIMVPSHHLSVAITSWAPLMQDVLSALWEEVLPGLDDTDDDPAELAALEDRLATLQAMPTPAVTPRPWEGLVDQVPFTLSGHDAAWILRWGVCDDPIAVGVDTWAPTLLHFGARTLEVASRLIAGETGDQQLVVAVLNSPHTLRVDLPSGSSTASSHWTPEGLRSLSLDALAQEFTR